MTTAQNSNGRIETAKYVIHTEPRISATKLAEFVVADPSRQRTIIKQAKIAPKVIMFPYSRVRSTVGAALGPQGLNAAALLAKAGELDGMSGNTQWQQDDLERSSEALGHLAAIAGEIDCSSSQVIHRPEGGWGYLLIAGVRVSVNPELMFTVRSRGVTKVGGLILNTGKSDDLSLARTSGRYTVGDYLTALLYKLVEQRASDFGPPVHTRCYAVDVFREQVYHTPASFKTLLNHLEAACEAITLRWPTIPVPTTDLVAALDEDEDIDF